MRNLSPQFAASLSGGATTLCHCWRLVARDGGVIGFTDHDRDLAFGGVVYAAAAGLEASALDTKLGFAVGGGEVSGALASASLSETDLASGRYDGATLEIWRVDWSSPQARLLLDIGVIGEVSRSEFAFTAEVRSRAHEFDQPVGRHYQAGCDADLGDTRCGVSLASPAFQATGSVIDSDGGLTMTLNITGFADGWFDGGVLRFTSGANAGARVAIKSHRAVAGGTQVSVWTPLAGASAANDFVVVTAGCDKSFTTCRAKYANPQNFRGFPHMPGNDVVLSYPSAGDPLMDGGSLFP